MGIGAGHIYFFLEDVYPQACSAAAAGLNTTLLGLAPAPSQPGVYTRRAVHTRLPAGYALPHTYLASCTYAAPSRVCITPYIPGELCIRGLWSGNTRLSPGGHVLNQGAL